MRENTDQKKLRIWTHFTQCFLFISREVHDSQVGLVSIIYTNIIQGTIQECNLLYVFLFRDYASTNTP